MHVGNGPWLIVYSDVIYNAYNNKLQQNRLRDFQKHLPATARKLKTYILQMARRSIHTF